MDLTQLTLRQSVNTMKIHAIHQKRYPSRKWDAFVFYISGECTYEYEGLRFTAHPGELVYLPKGKSYAVLFSPPAPSCLLVNFDADYEGARIPLCRRPENPGQIQDVMEALVRMDQRPEKNRQPWMLSLLYQLIALLEAPAAYLPGSKKDKLKNALELMEKEYGNPDLRCAQLALACRISDKYFQQLFKSAYGMTPIDFLSRKRLQKARQLLVETDAPIGDIAQRCGFSSLYYFSRVFKASQGQSPSEYRKSASIT